MAWSRDEALRRWRWRDFRRRVDHAPQNVYRHRTRGWEYIPIHPFGDEAADLARLNLRPEECWGVDAWWGIDGDATLFQSSVASISGRPAQLLVHATPHRERRVYVRAVIDAPFITRSAFEAAMEVVADAGFPNHPRFRLRDGDAAVVVR